MQYILYQLVLLLLSLQPSMNVMLMQEQDNIKVEEQFMLSLHHLFVLPIFFSPAVHLSSVVEFSRKEVAFRHLSRFVHSSAVLEITEED